MSRQSDRETSESVLRLQVYTKCAISRKKGPFERTSASNDLVRSVTSQLSQGLNTTAAYLENIGAVELDGQLIVPSLPENPAMNVIPEGWIPAFHVFAEGGFYVDLRGLEDPPVVNSGGVFKLREDRRRFVAHGVINFSELVMKYTRLLARIEKKSASAITTFDLESGKESYAQLLGSRNEPEGYTFERKAWCT